MSESGMLKSTVGGIPNSERIGVEQSFGRRIVLTRDALKTDLALEVVEVHGKPVHRIVTVWAVMSRYEGAG